MANQNSFTKEEWQTLQFGALWVFAVVLENLGNTSAQIKRTLKQQPVALRGLMGTAIEQAAAKQKNLETDVLFSIVMDTKQLLIAFTKDTRKPLIGLKQLSEILEQKAPEEAQEFRTSLLGFAEKMMVILGNGYQKAYEEQMKNARIFISIAFKVNKTQEIKVKVLPKI
jgi:hypothetical protein